MRAHSHEWLLWFGLLGHNSLKISNVTICWIFVTKILIFLRNILTISHPYFHFLDSSIALFQLRHSFLLLFVDWNLIPQSQPQLLWIIFRCLWFQFIYIYQNFQEFWHRVGVEILPLPVWSHPSDTQYYSPTNLESMRVGFKKTHIEAPASETFTYIQLFFRFFYMKFG